MKNTQRVGFWCDQFDSYFIWELLATVARGFRRGRGNPNGRTKGELGSKAWKGRTEAKVKQWPA